MIGTSTFEWCLIRTSVFLLRYVALLCALYLVAVLAIYGLHAAYFPISLLIAGVATAETIFYLSVFLPYRTYLQRDALHPPELSRPDREALFRRCNKNIPDGEAYLSKWFLGASTEEIKRENLKEFYLWAFFNRGGPPGEDNEELEEYIARTEELLGRKIEPGRGRAKCLRLTLDKVDMLHRTLVWYLIVSLVDLFTHTSLLYHGFHFHRLPFSKFFKLFPFRPQTLLTTRRSPVLNTSYWHRAHTSKTKLPVLFIHGIGIGLLPYVDFLAELNSKKGVECGGPDDQVGIIAIEILPISFRITQPALSKSALCEEIARILAYHGWEKVVLVSHSYGTVITTHLLKTPSTASLIGPVLLIDPVSILLHLPDVAYNFTRRKPKAANEHQLYYFASTDMGVSHTLARHFFWSENILWKEDMEGRNFTVSLSGKDLIVDTESVGRYLTSEMTSLPVLLNLSSPLVDVGGNNKINMNSASSSDTARHAVEEGDGNGSWKEQPWKGVGIDVLWFESQDHAQVFDKPATRRPLLFAIQKYCAGECEAINV